MTPAGMAKAAAATAALPPRTVTVAMKTPAVTAITEVQTAINNQSQQRWARVGSATAAGMVKAAAATAVLPPRAAAVVMNVRISTHGYL